MSDYLTNLELAAFNSKQVRLEKGYTSYSGHVFTEYECELYNSYLYDLSTEKHKPTRDVLLNNRCFTFQHIIGAI